MSGWTETGGARFDSGQLGNGLGLPSSESVLVPVEGTDYLEVTVPGDGHTLRGAFLATVREQSTRVSLDLGQLSPLQEPFGNPWPGAAPSGDSYLFGRVKAMLEPEAVKVLPLQPVGWAVSLDEVPMLALLSFEVLDVDVENPPVLTVNGRDLGPVTPQWPDLADPAFQGEVRPREADSRFHYTGWLRCQKVIPASALTKGVNDLDLEIGQQTGPVAVRAVQLQLKHAPADLEYSSRP